MAYMPAELDDEYDFEDGFIGDEDVLKSYMANETEHQSPSPKLDPELNMNQKTTSIQQERFEQSQPQVKMKMNEKDLKNGRNGEKSSSNYQTGLTTSSSSWNQSPPSWNSSSSSSNSRFSSQHYLTAEDLKIAAVKGNVQLAQKCLLQDVNVNEVLKTGWTALMYACNHGKSQVVEFLLKEGGNPSYHADLFTPLMCACSSSAAAPDGLNCVKLLVESGADVNAKDRHHSTGLILASRLGHLDIVKYLLDNGANINDQDSRGWTALTWSVQRGHKEVVITLLESDANCNIKHADRLTVRDMAAHLPTDEMLALLERRPAVLSDDPNMTLTGMMEAKAQGLVSSSSILSEGDGNTKSTDLRYGEMEIFLLGLNLPHLVPLFQKHLIDLFLLLDMSEQDLINVGVEQLGARKKILDASQAVHKKNWEASSLVSVHFNKRICCADAVAMIANVSKHIRYINSTVVYVRHHLHHHPHSIMHATDSASPTQLGRHVADTTKHVQQLQTQLDVLFADLSQEMKNFNVDPSDLITSQTKAPSFPVKQCIRICGLLTITAGLLLLLRNTKGLGYLNRVTPGKWLKWF